MSEIAHIPDIRQAISVAVEGLHYYDKSDELGNLSPHLWTILDALGGPALVDLVEHDPERAYREYVEPRA